MGEFIGSIGGFMMVCLIVILFYKLILDTLKNKNNDIHQAVKKFALPALILGLVQICISGLIISYYDQPTSAFDISSIWKKVEVVKSSINLLDSYSIADFSTHGIMPIYYILVKLLASCLFNAYESCALYISFLSGIATFVFLGLFFKRKNERKYEQEKACRKTNLAYSYLLCIPGSIILFLPCDFALSMAFFSIFLFLWDNGNGSKKLSLLFAILSLGTHYLGTIAVAIYIIGLIIKKEELKNNIINIVAFTIQIAFLIVHAVNNSGLIIQNIVLFEIFLNIILNSRKKENSHYINNKFKILLVLFNGFFITGALISAF